MRSEASKVACADRAGAPGTDGIRVGCSRATRLALTAIFGNRATQEFIEIGKTMPRPQFASARIVIEE